MQAMMQSQQQQHQQVSFHFWNCQLTEASPKYSWDPENWSAAATADSAAERRHKRTGRHGDGNGDGDTNGDAKVETEKSSTGRTDGVEKTEESGSNGKTEASAADGADKNGDTNANGDTNGEDIGDEAIDTDYMQHILKVNACIVGPKATGIHLITVRTRCYQSEPDSCPLVCIDPASQRTLALGFEFVLDSQNEVTFELVEGAGPVWLTGLHQVRVNDDDSEDELADADAAEEVGSEAGMSDESMKEVDEDDDAEEEEEEEEDEEEDSEEEEVIRPPAKRIARTSKSERPVPSPRQQSRRGPAKTAKSKSPPPPKAKPKGKGAASGSAAVAKKKARA